MRNRLSILGLLFFLVVGSVRADELTDILNKHAEAMGGKQRLASLKTLVVRGKVEVGGMKLDYVEHFLAPDKLRQVETLSGRESILIFDGKNAWSRDGNGKVARLTGEEARSTKTEVYAFGLGYIGDPDNWKYFKLLGKDKKGNHLIEFNAPDSNPIKFHIDPRSYLITMLTQKQDGEIYTATQEDYRTIDGIPFAFKALISNGKPQFDQKLTIEKVEINPTLDVAEFAKPDTQHDYRWTKNAKQVELPFRFDGDHLYAKIKVNGEDALMLLDTGAGSNVLSAKLVKKLKLKPEGAFEVKGGGGSTNGAIVNGVHFEMDGLTIDNQSVIQLDIPLLSAFNVPISGILGYDFFSRFVVKFDYENRKLTLYDPEVFKAPKESKAVAMELDGRTPIVLAEIDNIPLKARLDTGADGTVSFDHSFVKAHKLKDKYPHSIKAFSAGAGGLFTETTHRIQKFNLAGFELTNLLVNFTDNNKGVASENVQGNIGNELLRQFTLVLDYGNEKAYFTPNTNFGKSTEEFKVGISMLEEQGKIVIAEVSPHSPAKRAGIKAGDEIVALNGKKTQGLKIEQVRSQIDSKQSKEYIFIVKREGKQHTIKLKSARLLEIN